jgi:hypothetical protein
MKRQTLIFTLCTAVLAIVLLAAGCTLLSHGTPTPVPTVPTAIPTTIPTATPAPSSCGLTNCHGLDVACGANPPQVCTEEYKVGDRCRKYARCDNSGGGCTLVTDPQFNTCKTCVQQCEIGAGVDDLAALSCEEKC